MAMDGGSDWTEYTQTWNAQAGEVWPVFSAAFAADSELLYTGDGSGRLTTYTLGGAGEALERQTSFQCAHTPLSRLFALRSNHVLAQSSDTLQLRTAGGRRIFGKTTTPNDPFTAAALNISTYSDVLVCTSAGTASLLDLSRGAVVKRINLESSTVALDLDRAALTSGTAAGYLAVRDPRANFNLVHSASVFSGPVSDIVTTGKFIYACGAKAGAGNAYHMARDNMVRVYDRRNMSACLDAIDCEDSGTPAKLSINGNDLWICHDSGYADARVLDNHDHSSAFIEPELGEYAYASAFCLSPSGSAALVADTDGVLHLWANQESPQLSVCGKDPDLHCSNAQHTWNVRGSGLRIDDEHISLSVVPLPQIKEPLLSRMDNDVLCDVGRPVTFVDPEIIGHLKKIDSVEYAPNPRNYTRNQQAFGPQWRAKWKDGADAFKDDAELTQGRSKFLSVQRHRGEQQLQPPAVASSGILNEGRVSSIDTNASRGSPSVQQQVQQQVGATRFPIDMVSGGKIPKQMQRMRIEYSRFGVEDFDFSLYNSTQWSGLEGNITNSYANSLLQMLFFTAEFRSLVMSHCATDCPATKCLSCQMGLLFRMLQTANGTSCQAVQLLNILADRSEATALALLEDAHGNLADGATYSIVAQRLLRFFLEQANNECAPLSDGLRHKGQQRFVEQIIGFPQETKTICPACRHTQVRTSHAFSVDLDSPQGSNGLATLLAGGSASVRRAEKMRSGKKTDILELLQQSLARCDTTRAWCAQCKKFQFLSTHRWMTQAPSGYMAVNFPKLDLQVPTASSTTGSTGTLLAGGGADSATGGAEQQGATSWQTTLPLGFSLRVGHQNKRQQQVHVAALDTRPESEDKKEEDAKEPVNLTYHLSAVISTIRDTPRGPEHLVIHVRNPDKHDGSVGSWLLFNDFLVQPVSEESVVGLSDWWRAPTVALYASADRQCLADALAAIVDRYPYKISTRILTHPASVLDRASAGNRRANSSQPGGYVPNRNQAVPLTGQEADLVEKGQLICAFDAEFVVLEAAKTEVFSDGTQQVLQPEIHTLARLSMVRAGGGALHGVPFVDDYVETTRPIADLATQYSGIHAGDLTVGTSPYKLSTMKEAYKKLRLLVDCGCIIIGHGLKHDFRVCNIVVPAAQQRDTMVLFQSPQHIRPIALRFLYWFFYQKHVQTGEHSSVEDAQTALKVFESYRRCVGGDGEYDIGGIEDILDQIYESGSKLAWKTPDT